MTVKNVEKLEKSRVAVTVEVGAEEFEAAVAKAYAKARGKLSIPGFRPGKAPRKMIEKLYGAGVFYSDAVDIALPEAYTQAIGQSGLDVVGYPEIEIVDDKIDENGFTFKATVAVYPEVKLGDYKGLEVEKAEVEVAESEIDAELDRMANNVARITTVDRPAQEGDTAVIDYEGFRNGIAFQGGKGEDYELKLGSHTFIPGFEEQVVGMSAGEEKDIELTFPEDYHAKELAGAPVVFKVKVKEVKETVVPEKDVEFVKDVSEFDTVAELRAEIEKRIREEKQNGIDRAFENAAIEKAVENMTVEIPDSMVEEELDQELERMDYELRSQGASLQAYAQMIGGSMDTMRNSLRPSALHAVKTNVMLDAVVDAEKLEVTDEECEEEYKRLADSYKLEVEKVKEILDEKGMRGDLQVKKAAKLIADSAVAVPVKKDEETKAE